MATATPLTLEPSPPHASHEQTPVYVFIQGERNEEKREKHNTAQAGEHLR
jgi:hypothetical protein